jgi:hypothetical protein
MSDDPARSTAEVHDDEEPIRRPSAATRIVAVVVVVAVVLSAAAVVLAVLTSDDTQVDAADTGTELDASTSTDPPASGPADGQASQQPTTTQMSPCSLLDPASIAAALGVASVEVVGGGADPSSSDEPGCRVVGEPWAVTYTAVEASSPGGGLPLEPVAVGDEAYVTTSNDRSGSWTAVGFVRVGDRMTMLTVKSDARGADTYPASEGPPVQAQVRERAVALLEALAARL